MLFTPKSPLIVWRLIDGKPGHEKQTRGLANALARLVPTEIRDVEVNPGSGPVLAWLRGRFPAGDGLPAPHLILAAGHATHFSALAARRAYGGRVIVLMKPSLPYWLFDLCLVPAHDQPPYRSNVESTRGAINAVIASGTHDPATGLILIGGPSEHYFWDDREIARQVRELVADLPGIRWTLTTSRRTPAGFLELLEGVDMERLPVGATPPGWLESQLADIGQAWITPDSVSMVYEALTAGCRVGLLELRPRIQSRVAQGMAALLADGLVSSKWGIGDDIDPAGMALDEAGRCARLILERWFR